jgi:hypothetical protein
VIPSFSLPQIAKSQRIMHHSILLSFFRCYVHRRLLEELAPFHDIRDHLKQFFLSKLPIEPFSMLPASFQKAESQYLLYPYFSHLLFLLFLPRRLAHQDPFLSLHLLTLCQSLLLQKVPNFCCLSGS